MNTGIGTGIRVLLVCIQSVDASYEPVRADNFSGDDQNFPKMVTTSTAMCCGNDMSGKTHCILENIFQKLSLQFLQVLQWASHCGPLSFCAGLSSAST